MGKETPAQLQSRARLMCERDGLTQQEIADRIGKAVRTVANWAERGLPSPIKGPWVKGSLAEKVHQKREEGILAAALARGMTDDYFVGKLQELLEAKTVRGTPNLDAIDKGLTHAERIIPGLKATETHSLNFPAEMLAFFQGAE